ncbi:hypothetical protein NMG60_11030697 [Bertholletia excelsa]
MAATSMPFFGIRDEDQNQMKQQQQQHSSAPTSSTTPTTAPQKKRRNLSGASNPDAEVIALSPKTLMATNRFICEVCNKGFQREQNLQLHRRGHNLPWKLKQKATNKEVKRKVYLCPEPTCVHHDPSRALGDLTGIKKHYFRKHGEKKYKCEKCSKRYAVQSDWKAHSKICGTREYRCDCGTLFSRRDSFITHRAFCDALAQESVRHPSNLSTISSHLYGSSNLNPLGLSHVGPRVSQLQGQNHPSASLLQLGNAVGAKYEHLIPPPNPPNSLTHHPLQSISSHPFFAQDSNQGFQDQAHQAAAANFINPGFFSSSFTMESATNNSGHNHTQLPSSAFLSADQFNLGDQSVSNSGLSSLYNTSSSQHEKSAMPHMSATALLQKAAQMGSTTSSNSATLLKGLGGSSPLGVKPDNENHLQGLMNSLANGSSMFGSNRSERENSYMSFDGSLSGINPLEQQQSNASFGNMDKVKLAQNLSGSDRMTLDFLGVGGGMLRNLGVKHGIDLSSLDPKIN